MEYEVYFQLVLSLVLGAVLGVERKLSHKTAGMRTFAFVAMGSTIFSIISNLVGSDPSRIAAQIVVGIGFLGAGLIIFREDSNASSEKVWGLTTAASLWVAAAIGMAVGYKFYMMAIASTILALIIFIFLWWVEDKITSKLPNFFLGNRTEE